MTGRVILESNPVATTAPMQVKPNYDVENWRHRIAATIGFDTASCKLRGAQSFLEGLFSSILGNKLTRYSADGGQVVWEGYVNAVTLNLPGVSYSLSLDQMFNRVRVRYTVIDATTTPPSVTGATTRTATASDTPSQSRYGIKDMILSAGETSATIAEQIRAVALAQYKQPRRSAIIRGGNDVSLDMACLGYGHTLDWQVYNYTGATGTQNANLQIADILTAAGQFIAATQLTTNATPVPKYRDFDQTALEQIQAIAEQGDSSGNRWLVSVLEDRRLYYQAASATIAYWRRVSDERQAIRNVFGGGEAPYELVRPDRWLRLTDVGIGKTGGYDPAVYADDFQLIYIESVEWAEPDSLTLVGSVGDNLQTSIARQAQIGARVL